MFDHSRSVTVTGGSMTQVHGNSVTNINTTGSDEKGLQILQSKIATGAMHDSLERYDAPKCHEDTREAVIKDITNWALDQSKDTLILWISAPAGSGKSAILQTIANRFGDSGRLAASFFFSRTAAQRQTEAHLIATIANQLAKSIPATKPFIDQAVRDDLSVFNKTLPVQMKHLVIQPLICASLQAGRSSEWPSLLVIDGLDECTGGKVQAVILRMLNDALLQLKHSLPSLYLLIASRPEPAICEVFEDKLKKITYHLVLDKSYDPDRDIAAFLRHSFSDICRRGCIHFPSMSSLPLPWPPKDVISFLVEKSSGQFIFAATVIRFLDEDRKFPPDQLKLVLDICKSLDASQHKTNPFVLLDELYAHILRSCHEIKEVLLLLSTIFSLDHNDHALTPVFLESLVGTKFEDITLSFWDLHSIIHVPASRTDTIRFYHASFRDYFVDHHRSKDLHFDEHVVQYLLLKSCMQQLCNATIGPAMDYSLKSWSNHYTRGDSLLPGSLDTLLKDFKPLAHWGSNNENETIPDLSYWWSIYNPIRTKFDNECTSVVPDGTSQSCRFNSALDQHLLSWLQEYPWTKLEIALAWLTLLLRYNSSLSPRWEPLGSSDNPGISWLWNSHHDGTSERPFLHFLLAFLQCPNRCHHLFIGKAPTPAHFAYLCAQIVRDSCSGSTELADVRYINCLHKMLERLLDYHFCSYPNDVKKCIKSQLCEREVFVNEVSQCLIQIPQPQSSEFHKSIGVEAKKHCLGCVIL